MVAPEKFDLHFTFGPLTPLFLDPTVEEIWLNSPQRIFVARNGKNELTTLLMSSEEVQNIVERALMWSGRRLDLSQPFVDARLPDGSRLHVAIPQITSDHWAVNIRRHLLKSHSLDELANSGLMPLDVAAFLANCVKKGCSIIVSGGTQAGKTTLLSALMSQIPVTERVITIEEVFELSPLLPDVVAMQTRDANLQGEGQIPLRRLIKEALRMRPSRIIVGEVREAEAMDLLIALNSGLPGMGTIHANSVRGALMKLQTLPLLTGENIPERFILPAIASAIDLIVQIKIDQTGTRRVTEVGALSGRVESGTLEIENIYRWDASREATSASCSSSATSSSATLNTLGIAAISDSKPEKFQINLDGNRKPLVKRFNVAN